MFNHEPTVLYRLTSRSRILPINTRQKSHLWKYKSFSDMHHCLTLARFNQSMLLTYGRRVQCGRCKLSVWPTPCYSHDHIHIEARDAATCIEVEDGVWINNNAVIIAERGSIRIGTNTLIGTEFTVYDSDFHDLHPERRLEGTHECAPVNIGKNVFIGSRVMVMKGVNIGDNSVIASGSIVTKSVPENSIAGGSPARVIRSIRVEN